MAKKKSIWDDDNSPYGTYDDKDKGNTNQWSNSFSAAFENSASIQHILGVSSYSVLGLTPSVSDEDVKKAYRIFAKKYHPDNKETGNESAFRKYTTAYEKIKNLRLQQKVPIQQTINNPPKPNNFNNHDIIIPQLLTPITEDQIEDYLTDPNYCGQEKKDGKHLTLQILNGQLIVRNKQGIACNCSPEFEDSLRAVGHDILIDGEQIGNKFWTWDILEFNGENLRNLTYLTRYQKLSEMNFGSTIKILGIAITEDDKRKLYEKLKTSKKEGIVFKRITARFTSGKSDDQFKLKFYADCSVIVVEGRKGKASIGMELINENGKREFVGYCSCNKNPPIGSIADVKYLYAYRNGCLYQTKFKWTRDDVDINECTTSQLKYKSEED
jgi:bifunctional non-homologous end joining protein LigD